MDKEFVLGVFVAIIAGTIVIVSLARLDKYFTAESKILANMIVNDTIKFVRLGRARGADVFYIRHADHECFMVSAGNSVSIYCPK